MFEKLIHLDGIDPLEFFGVNNAKMNLIKSYFPKLIIACIGNDVIIKGDDEERLRFESKFHLILDHYNQFNVLPDDVINQVFLDESESVVNNPEEDKNVLLYGINGKPIRARTPNQRLLVEVSRNSDLIFAIGPAGSGKTYTAIALAVRALKNREIKRIILSRPAVEAGERLGFLPGDLKEKIDPYLQPLYDALLDMIPAKKLDEFMKDGTIQIAPLAFMRGRTLSNAFVILDEAQNTTINQMKMFLTRMGLNTKFVVTGDETQIDLPMQSPSGLILAKKILKNIKDISFVQFDVKDIVRHRLVRDIVMAYERHHAHELARQKKDKEKKLTDKKEKKMDNALTRTDFNFSGQKNVYHGKVRDVYNINDNYLVMVVSDRISAFDVVLPKGIPYKGQVLNQIAAKFLDATSDIVPNWKVATPDPNVTVGLHCEPFKVEMVIRGYLTGHAWREYRSGKRLLCGVVMPDGMVENQKFAEPIITPTTKAHEGHDEDISREEIIAQGIVSKEDYEMLEDYTRKVFQRGTEMAAEKGLILVDTKYEFGKNGDKIYLIDEIHTPDSSRYFYAEGYEERLAKCENQKQLSKEFVRQWLIENGFQGKEGQLIPEMDEALVLSVSERYIELFENITGDKFIKSDLENIQERIETNIQTFLKTL